ncbi:MAG: PAS domain S-box protein [Leptolyngbya sp. BL-A-14]
MNQQRYTILIVDDSPEDRELYRRYLLRDTEATYTVLEAALGQQGLDLWQQHQPDAVLLDYRMPDLDGLDFLAQLQSPTAQPCLPVIVVTGQGNEAIAVQAIKAGAQDYLIKGQITPDGLQVAVNGAIEAVRLRTQLQQRIDRERVVGQITRQIHQSLDLDRILQTTVTEVREFLHTDRVLVFQLQSDGHGTVVAESVGTQWQSLLTSTIYDPCLAANYLRFSRSNVVTHDAAFDEEYVKRYRQGEVTAIPDIHDSSIDPCHVELLASFEVKANLVVPVLHDDLFWGLLIAHHCEAPRAWQPLEIDLLKELATQVGIALRQAELYQRSQAELAERQQVEVALRASEERLRVALEASRMGTWDWHIQAGQITWSANLEALFGLEPGAFDGSFEMFATHLHPDDRDRVLAAIQQAVATGEDYDIEFRVVYPNGTIRWALSQGKVFYDDTGQPVRMAGVDIDITDRKQAAEILRESEERFRQLAENIDAVFWIKEASDDRVSYVSPAYERLWGLHPQELLDNAQAWVNYIHPDDREGSFNAFQEKAAAGQFDEEYRIILPSGNVRWVHDRCFPLQDETGRVYRLAGIAEDVTDRKQIEEMLRLQAQILDQTHDSVVSTDLDGYITSWNRGAERVLGYAAEEVLGQHISTLYPSEQHGFLEQQIIAPLQEKGMHEVEVTALHKAGNPRDLLLSLSLLRDEHQNPVGMIGFSMDITDRKGSERALRESEERFRTSVENMLDCFAIYKAVRNEQGAIVDFQAEYINDAACLVTQLPREQHLSQGLCALLPTHRDSGLFEEYCQVVETGQSLVKDSLVYEDNFGEQRLTKAFDIRVAKFGDGYVATWRDITDRKQTEEALRQNEELLRLTLESAHAGSWNWDLHTNKVVWSPENYDLYGLSPEREPLQYEDWYHALHPEDRERASTEVSQVVEQRLLTLQTEFRVVHPQRGTRWLLALGRLILDEQGEPLRLSGINLDITDRKQAEDSLRQSEEFKRRMLDSSSDCIKLLNLNGQLLYMNTGGLCLLEIDDFTPYVNAAWSEFWPLTDRQVVEDAIAVAKTGEAGRFQGFCPTAKGTPKWWDVVVTPILDAEGRAIQLLATSRDITERRQSEIRLQESEARLKLAHKATRSGLWDWDVARNMAHVSEEYCALLGLDPTVQEVSFEQWLERVHPDDRSAAADAVRETLQQRQEYYTADYRILHPDGIRWLAARAQAFYATDGTPLRLLGNVQDISDRKHAEASLRASEERYRTLFESMEDGFCVIELIFDDANTPNDYRFLELNPAFAKQTGLTQVEGQTARQLIPSLENHWFEIYGRVALTGEPVRFESASDALNRWFDVYAFRLGRPESRKVAILFKEISERKQAEQERERLLAQEQAARAEAERANRIKDEFLAVLSHELRSPLNPILGWTKLLQTRKFDETRTAEALATIERNARLQTQLIDDLLDVAKILRGKLSMDTSPVDLVFVIESAIDTVRTAAISKSILLRPVLPQIGRVAGDSARLQQVVWNLLSNAIKFTPNNGRVDIWLERVDHWAQITVSDTGKGINPDFLPHLFESFRQEDASTTRKYGGLGLGLAIVRSLVEAHGGIITANSPGEGLGAIFTVRLPLLDTALTTRPPDEAPVQDLDLTGFRVLAVDDEPDARELLNILLAQYGAEVLTVTSAAEVLIALESFKPDALVSDIGMPEIDGYTLIRQIRALPAEKGGQIPAIALTAYAREEDYQRAIANGYQQQITKPLDPQQLVHALITLLADKRQP